MLLKTHSSTKALQQDLKHLDNIILLLLTKRRIALHERVFVLQIINGMKLWQKWAFNKHFSRLLIKQLERSPWESYQCHRRGSRQRSTWPRYWVTCRCVCFHQRRAGCRWGARPNAGTAGSRFLSEWTWTKKMNEETYDTQWHWHRHKTYDKEGSVCICTCVDLPCPRVDIIAIEVINKPIFVGRKCFVASVNIHAAAGRVICAAVAVTSLRDGTFGLRHQPHVGPWQWTQTERICYSRRNFLKNRKASISSEWWRSNDFTLNYLATAGRFSLKISLLFGRNQKQIGINSSQCLWAFFVILQLSFTIFPHGKSLWQQKNGTQSLLVSSF